MPSILFQPTSLSFGDAKTFVAEQFSKQSATGMLNRAGRAIQRAFGDWNKHNWEWNVVTAADITVTAGTSEYTLPFDFRDLYACVLTTGGASRVLASDSFRNYIRHVPTRQAGFSTGYNLLRRGSTGKIQLVTTPQTDGLLEQFHYYRRMIIPCSVSATGSWSASGTTITLVTGSLSGAHLGNILKSAGVTDNYVVGLDIGGSTLDVLNPLSASGASAAFTVGGDDCLLDVPEDYVWNLLPRACEHFLVSVNAPEKLISYWAAAARAGLSEAKGSLNNQADRIVAFVPEDWDTTNFNPNLVIE